MVTAARRAVVAAGSALDGTPGATMYAYDALVGAEEWHAVALNTSMVTVAALPPALMLRQEPDAGPRVTFHPPASPEPRFRNVVLRCHRYGVPAGSWV
jgi:hypothetical protein